MVTTGQFGVENRRLAGGQAFNSVVHTLEHGAGAYLVGQPGGRIHFLVIDFRADVNGEEVIRGCRPVNVGKRTETSAQLIERLFDVLVGSLYGLNGDLDTAVIRQFDLGANVDLYLEVEVTFIGLRVRHRGNLDLGLAQRADLGLANCVLVEVVQAFIHRGFDDVGAPHPLVDQTVGDFTLTETGHLNLRGDSFVGLIDLRLQFLKRNLNRQLYSGRVEVLDSALHVRGTPENVGFRENFVGATGLEPAIPCSQSRCASHYATPRSAPQVYGQTPVGAHLTSMALDWCSYTRSIRRHTGSTLVRYQWFAKMIWPPLRGCSSMVEPQFSKLITRVRFPSSPPSRFVRLPTPHARQGQFGSHSTAVSKAFLR